MNNAIHALLQRKQAAIMGVINVTPDSFSDGGQFHQADAALRQAEKLAQEGADILDIGGESTRPGAEEVSEQQELDRVLPVIEQISKHLDTPVSIDTYKPRVMNDAVRAGAQMINDVSALQSEGAIAVALEANVPICLMHMQNAPANMQNNPYYDDVVDDVVGFLNQRIEACLNAGISRSDLVVDPGIGFGKSLEHNLALLAAINKIKKTLSCEVLIGVSRKSMIDHLLGRAVSQRQAASLGLAVQSVLNGAKIVRVHDVQATYDAVRSVEAVQQLQLS